MANIEGERNGGRLYYISPPCRLTSPHAHLSFRSQMCPVGCCVILQLFGNEYENIAILCMSMSSSAPWRCVMWPGQGCILCSMQTLIWKTQRFTLPALPAHMPLTREVYCITKAYITCAASAKAYHNMDRLLPPDRRAAIPHTQTLTSTR